MPRTSRRRERQRPGLRGRPHKGPRSGSGTPLPTRVPLAGRIPLPTDPEATPPLPGAYHDVLSRCLAHLGYVASPGVRVALDAQVRLLVAWNDAINLTAIRAPEAIAVEHVADSLSALPLVRALLPRPLTLLDIGSGPGYPGLPLGLALGAERIVLVESVGKKAAFLRAAAEAVSQALVAAGEPVPEIVVVAERAETLAGDPHHHERAGLVTARAVAPLARLVPLALPLVARGGLFAAWKREDGTGSLEREVGTATQALRTAGLDRVAVQIERVELDGLRDHRLVLVRRPPRPVSRAPD